jgi:hypothetical protein
MKIQSSYKTEGKVLAVPVQVWCGSYRCLAYKDADDQWRDYHNGAPLPEPVRIVEPWNPLNCHA